MKELSSREQRSVLDAVIENGILLLVIVPPLLFGAVHAWASAVMQLTAFVVFAAWLLQSYRSGMAMYRPGAAFVLLALFLLLVLAQLIPLPLAFLRIITPTTADVYRRLLGDGSDAWRTISIAPERTLEGLLRAAAYAAVLFVVMHHYRERKKIQRLLLALVGMACFLVLFAVVQKMLWNGRLYWFYPIDSQLQGRIRYIWGPYVNRNHFAGYLEMVLPLVFGMIVYETTRQSTLRRRTDRVRIPGMIDRSTSLKMGMLILASLMLVAGLITTLSRGGILAFAVSSTVFAFLMKSSRSLKRSTALLTAIGLVVLSVVGIASWERIAERYGELAEDALIARPAVWNDALPVIYDHPIMGTGLGTFEVAFPRYQKHYSQTFFEHAENDYLEITTDTGIPGVLLVIAMGCLFLMNVVRQWRHRRNTFSKSIAAGGIATAAAVATHSFVDFNMHVPANAMSLAIVAGITYAALFSAPSGERRSFKERTARPAHGREAI